MTRFTLTLAAASLAFGWGAPELQAASRRSRTHASSARSHAATRSRTRRSRAPSRNRNPGYRAPSRNRNPGYRAPSRNRNPGYRAPSRNRNPGYRAPSRNRNPGYRAPSRNRNPGYRAPSRHRNPGYRAPSRHRNPGYRAPSRHRNPGYRAPSRHRGPRYRQPRRYRRIWRGGRFLTVPLYTAQSPAQVIVTNQQTFGIQVRVRAGSSSICATNPVLTTRWLAPGQSLVTSSFSAFVCARSIGGGSPFDQGSGWQIQEVISDVLRFGL